MPEFLDIDKFKENIEENIAFLTLEVDNLPDYTDRQFCHQLLDFYSSRKFLSNAQLAYMVGYIKQLEEIYS